MAKTLKEVAKTLNISIGEIHKKMKDMGFPLSARTTSVGDATAEKIIQFFGGPKQKVNTVSHIRQPGAINNNANKTHNTRFKKNKFTKNQADNRENTRNRIIKPKVKKLKEKAILSSMMTVRDFADNLGASLQMIMSELIKNGIFTNANQILDFETMSIIASDLGVEIEEDIDASNGAARGEDTFTLIDKIIEKEDNTKQTKRPPVVSIMGHVDHGKTSLLDYIRKSDVVAKEAGGITQHIGAYQIQHQYENKNNKITFIDTPGHAAFTAMRSRGAKAVDIAILVVAGNDSIKPQTEEAHQHIIASGTPYIVAITKCDLKEANPDKVITDLLQINIQTEQMGGNIPCVKVSSKTGTGIEDLLDLICLTSDVSDLKANKDRNGLGIVIEAHKDQKLGNTATILMKTGTLNKNDIFVCGGSYGRTRIMKDWNHKNIQEALPSAPVLISGFSDLPETGDIFEVMESEQNARVRANKVQQSKQEKSHKISLSNISSRILEGSINTFNIIIKADVAGSLEAVVSAVEKISSEKAKVKVIAKAVGDTTDNDVLLAKASGATIFNFCTDTISTAKSLANKENVVIKNYNIIYKMVEDITDVVNGISKDKKERVEKASLKILGVFYTKLPSQTIGGEVTKGIIKKDYLFYCKRDDQEICNGKVIDIQKDHKDVNEVGEGALCGMKVKLDKQISLIEGDEILFYIEE